MRRKSDFTRSIRYEQAGGYTIGVRSNTYIASRQTVVLVHGLGVSGTYFVPLADDLATSYNVLALDFPGYGHTPRPPKPLTIQQLADVLAAFLQHHKITHSILLGHSMGCQIIAALYRTHPQLVAKMILLAPTVYNKERTIWMQAVRLLQDGFSETVRTNMTALVDYVRMGMTRYYQTARWMVEDRIEQNLDGVTVPVLIVRGGNDRVVPRIWVEYLRKRLPHIELEEVADAPHGVQLRFPQKVAALCRTFID